MIVCEVCGGTLTFGRLATDCHEFAHKGVTYQMDDATFDHLREYIRRYGPSDVDVLDEADRILTYLQSINVGEAEYLVNEGWGRCLDAANVAKAARA